MAGNFAASQVEKSQAIATGQATARPAPSYNKQAYMSSLRSAAARRKEQEYKQSVIDYFNGNEQNYDTTSKWTEEANGNVAVAQANGNKQDEDFWRSVAEVGNARLPYDDAARKQENRGQKAANDESIAKLSQQIKDLGRSAGIMAGDFAGEAYRSLQQALGQVKALKADNDRLDEELKSWGGELVQTPESQQRAEILANPQLLDADYDAMLADANETYDRLEEILDQSDEELAKQYTPEQIAEMEEQFQQAADVIRGGSQGGYWGWRNQAVGEIAAEQDAFNEQFNGGRIADQPLENLELVTGAALNNFVGSTMNAAGQALVTAGGEVDRAKALQSAGPEAVVLSKDERRFMELRDKGERTPEEEDEFFQLSLDMTPDNLRNIDRYDVSQVVTEKTGVTPPAPEGTSASDLRGEQFAERRAARGTSESGTPDSTSLLTRLGEGVQDAADTVIGTGQEYLNDALRGKGKAGQLAVKAGYTIGQMLGDAASGQGLKMMAARVFGETSAAARQQGATLSEQNLYGLSHAAIETATEHMFGVFGAYGKGFSDDFAESVVNNLARSEYGAMAIRFILSGVEEGSEEIAAGFLDPIAENILSHKGEYNIDMADMAESAIIGAFLGLVGGGGQIVSGQSAAMNAQGLAGMQSQVDAMYNAMYEENQAPTADDLATLERLSTRLDSKMTLAEYTDLVERGMLPPGKASQYVIGMGKGKADVHSPSAAARDAQEELAETKAQKKAERAQKEDERMQGYINRADEIGIGNQNWQNSDAVDARAQEVKEQLNQSVEDQEQTPEAQDVQEAQEITEVEENTQQETSAEAATLRADSKASESVDAVSGEITAPETQSAVKPSEISPETQKAILHDTEVAVSRGVPHDVAKSKASIDHGATNNQTVAQMVRMTDPYVSSLNPVTTVTGNVFESKTSDAKLPLTKRVARFFKQNYNNKVSSNKIGGDVIVNERGIKNDIAHGIGEAKVSTFAAIPAVLKNGEIVSRSDGSVKGPSITIAAPVTLDGVRANVYCVVKTTQDGNRFYLHEVSDSKGTLYYQFDANENAPSALQDSTLQTQGSADVASTESITENTAEINSTKSNSSGTTEEAKEKNTDSRKQLPEFPEDITLDEASEYARLASKEWPVYIETRDSTAFYYDGENLWSSDEDGKAHSPRKMSQEEFAGRLQKWADSEQHNYIVFENVPMEMKESEADKNENDEGAIVSIPEESRGANRGRKGLLEELSRRSDDVSRIKAKEAAKRYGSQREVDQFLSSANNLISEGAKYISEDEYLPFMSEIKKIAKSHGVKHVSLYYSSIVDGWHVDGIYSPDIDTLHLVINTDDDVKKTFKHELGHKSFALYQISTLKNLKEFCEKAFADTHNADRAKKQFDAIFKMVRREYARDYAESLQIRYTPEQWRNLTTPQKELEIARLSNSEKTSLDNNMYEEFIVEALADSRAWFIFDPDVMAEWQQNIRDSLISDGYFQQNVLDQIDALDISFNGQEQEAEKADSAATQNASKDTDFDFDLDEGNLSIPSGYDEPVNLDAIFGDDEGDLLDESKPTNHRERLKRAGDPVPQSRKEASQSIQNDVKRGGATRGEQINRWVHAKEVADKFGVSDGTYDSMKRADVSRVADYIIDKYGAAAERDRLLDSKNWNRVDFSIAQKVVYQMRLDLHRRMANSNTNGLGQNLSPLPGESTQEFKRRQAEENKRAYLAETELIDSLEQAYIGQKSEAGQKLQEQYAFSKADEIRMRATKRFLDWSTNTDGEFNGFRGNNKFIRMWEIVDDLCTKMQAAEDAGDVDAMVDLSKKVSYIRSNQSMFGKTGVKAERKFLDNIKGVLPPEMMADLAYGNINRIVDDFTPMTWADAVQTIRVNNMLSNIATGLNNLANNAVALRTGALAQNAGWVFGKALEKADPLHRKAGIKDKGLIRTKPIMSAEAAMMQYAVLNAYYGINVDSGRVDSTSKKTFRSNAGPVERALARYNFFVTAFVLSPDAPGKTRAKMGLQAGIDEAFAGADMNDKAVFQNRMELEGYARKEADRRLLQDDNSVTRAVASLKRSLNKIVTPDWLSKVEVGGRQLGQLKLGDHVIAFAKVPANVALQKAESTPFGALYHTCRYVGMLARLKADPNGVTSAEMAARARDMGRAATSAGMVALGAIAAAAGALRNFDEGDDEEKRLAKEKGYRGLQFNVSMIFHPSRWGGAWQDGDHIIGGSFLEIAAMPLAIGGFIYDAQRQGENLLSATVTGTKRSFADLLESIGELPGLQQAGQLWQNYSNSKGDSAFDKAWRTGIQQLVSDIPSYYMPNLISQAGAGLDNVKRDVYSGNSFGETLRNILMNKDPVLRRFIPEMKDTFGDTITYGSNKATGLLNTMVLPGDVHVYRQSDLEKEIIRMRNEGYTSRLLDVRAPRSFEVGTDTVVDLTTDEQRAYEERMTKLFDSYEEFRNSDGYEDLPDDMKDFVYRKLKMDETRTVKNEILEIKGMDERINLEKWESLGTTKEKIEFLKAKYTIDSLWDSEESTITDFDAMDDFVKNVFPSMSKEQQELLTNSVSRLDDMYEASRKGISSEKWQKAYNIYRDYTSEAGRNRVQGGYKGWEAAQMWTDMQKATEATSRQMEWFENNMRLYNQVSADSDKYHALVDTGWKRDTASRLVTSMAGLTPAGDNKNVSYKQNLTLIARSSYLSEDQKWAAFFEYCPKSYTKVIAQMTKARKSGMSYEAALKKSGKWLV